MEYVSFNVLCVECWIRQLRPVRVISAEKKEGISGTQRCVEDLLVRFFWTMARFEGKQKPIKTDKDVASFCSRSIIVKILLYWIMCLFNMLSLISYCLAYMLYAYILNLVERIFEKSASTKGGVNKKIVMCWNNCTEHSCCPSSHGSIACGNTSIKILIILNF